MWYEKLTSWFDCGHRAMPWRENPTPYYVLVSEVMLQQTQVATVIPYFQRFIARFPTLEALASADDDQVLKAWEGLGYYSRARHLHQAAQAIAQLPSGFPDDMPTLLTLPGIGRYTAAAIASIAFDKPYPVVDGNVLRIWTRMKEDAEPVDTERMKKRVYEDLLASIENAQGPSRFNQAMMELGAMICHPLHPDCTLCPLKEECLAAAHGTQEDFPVKHARMPVPHYHVAVALIFDGPKLLILRRNDEQMLGGLWEFPGGKLEQGETPAQAAQREVMEETGLDVTVKREIVLVKHAYSHFKITMHAFECALVSPAGALVTDRPYHWILPAQLRNFTFPKANHKIFAAMGLE